MPNLAKFTIIAMLFVFVACSNPPSKPLEPYPNPEPLPNTLEGGTLLATGDPSTLVTLRGSAIRDAGKTFEAHASIRLNYYADKASPAANFALPRRLNLENHSFRIRVWIAQHDLPSFDSITLKLYSDDILVYIKGSQLRPLPDQWTSYTFVLGDNYIRNTNPIEMQAITNLEIEYNSSAKDRSNSTVFINWIEAYKQPAIPYAVLIFDDNNLDTYSIVAPYVNQFGIKVSVPTVTRWLDTGHGSDGEALVLSQALEMQSKGHEFTVHGRNHLNPRLAKQWNYYWQQIEDDILGGKADLLTRGLNPKGVEHYVYPGGGETPETYNFVTKNFHTARLVGNGMVSIKGQDLHRLTTTVVFDSHTAGAYLDAIDNLSKWGGVMLLNFHRVLPAGTKPTRNHDITFDKFKVIIDHLRSNHISVITMTEYYALASRE